MARSQWMDAGASQTSAGQARRGAVVALSFSLAMAFGLAACTTSKPSPTPSVSSSPSPSLSVRPTPSSSPTWLPVRPDSTKSEGLDGAISTARFFLSLYPYVYQTGDLSGWQAMSHPDCEFCKSVSDNVTRMVAQGSRAVGGDLASTVSGATLDQAGGLSEITLRIEQQAGYVLRSDGTQSDAHPRGGYTAHVYPRWVGGLWVISGVNREEPPG